MPNSIVCPPAHACALARTRLQLAHSARVLLRSGVCHEFEISEHIFDYMESLRAQGLSGSQLCTEWLDGSPSADPPVAVHVDGQRHDGTPVRLDVTAAPLRAERKGRPREKASR